METNKTEQIKQAIYLAGGGSLVAAFFSISPAAVSKWPKNGQVPSERCIGLEKLSKGIVTRYELRPDIFGTPKKRKAA